MKKTVCLLLLGIFLQISAHAQQPDPFEKLFLEEVARSKQLALKWFENNFRDKGLWVYRYNPKTGKTSRKNNALRQLMASRMCAQYAHSSEKFLEMHQKNMAFITEYWVEEDDGRAYIYFSKKSKIGANAMLLRTLSHSPFVGTYKELAKKTADGILHLMKPSGELQPWYKPPSYNYDADYLMYFYSGEAIVSLLEYYDRFGGEKYLRAAQKAQDFYIAEYIDRMEENYYPAYVPWHTMSLNKLYTITGEKRYLKAAFTLTDKLLEIFDEKAFVGRFFNPATPEYGTPHVSSDGVYTEGLAYALELAVYKKDKKRVRRYRDCLYKAVTNLKGLQYDNPKDPEKIRGAFQQKLGDPRIRTDNVQHIVDAFDKIQEVWPKMLALGW